MTTANDITKSDVCPECEHAQIETFWADCPFPYGASPDTVELSVRVPVRKCQKCGFEFLDEEAEDLRHEAVCHHLGVFTPTEIVELRGKFRLSRAEFARLTGLGEATIARWERGELIQNEANDTLLWLLHHEDNMRRLQKRNQRSTGVTLRMGDPNDATLREKKAAFKIAQAS